MSKLFDTFEKVSLQDWNEKIIKDLNGADYKEKLVSSTEGVEINPVYSEENIEKIHPINFSSNILTLFSTQEKIRNTHSNSNSNNGFFISQ